MFADVDKPSCALMTGHSTGQQDKISSGMFADIDKPSYPYAAEVPTNPKITSQTTRLKQHLPSKNERKDLINSIACTYWTETLAVVVRCGGRKTSSRTWPDIVLLFLHSLVLSDYWVQQ